MTRPIDINLDIETAAKIDAFLAERQAGGRLLEPHDLSELFDIVSEGYADMCADSDILYPHVFRPQWIRAACEQIKGRIAG